MEGEGEKGDLVGVGGHINNGLREASLDTIEVLLLHTINPHACCPTNQPHLAVSHTSTLGTHGTVGSKHWKPWTPGVCVCSWHEKGTGAAHAAAHGTQGTEACVPQGEGNCLHPSVSRTRGVTRVPRSRGGRNQDDRPRCGGRGEDQGRSRYG